MVFASLPFLTIFLPLQLILYYAFGDKTYRNVLLTFFSLVFYAWGEPVWIVLLLFSSLVDYLNGLWIENKRGTGWEKLGLISSIIINLSLLAAFKYNVFIYENINLLLGTKLQAPHYSLPIGISFYTFQTISYSIDVYRGEVKAQRDPLKFLLFVSLFHQLVAGPIVRYAHVAHEIESRKETAYDISQGLLRFSIGLFKKVFIANTAGELARTYLGPMDISSGEGLVDFSTLSVGEAWFGILMFSIQIYFDFSGYSDMAIGLGRTVGFHYFENFNYPYISKSATDFWRRWHMSLGTFFRDYVYIPLGGNKKGRFRAYLNLFIVWALTGLWHGSSWNFVLWGLYYGILIFLERLFLGRVLKAVPPFAHLYLIIATLFGWTLFYFAEMDRLLEFLKIMVGAAGNPLWSFKLNLVLQNHMFWLILALLLCLPIYPVFSKWFEKVVRERASLLYFFGVTGIQILLLFLSITMLVGDTYNPFIYFRF
jgi:alginate O-acetyltransferase complex protein AlgI